MKPFVAFISVSNANNESLKKPSTEKLQIKHFDLSVYNVFIFWNSLMTELCESKKTFKAHPQKERMTMMTWLSFGDNEIFVPQGALTYKHFWRMTLEHTFFQKQF